MALKEIGFFKELRYGRENGPSINDYISDSDYEDDVRIINYIRDGKVFIASPGIVYDIFDGSKRIGLGPYILTDGKYVWLEELAYYIEQYHIKLPDEFILHMRANKWEVPKEIDLSKLEFHI